MLSRCLWNVNVDRTLVVRTLKVAYFVLVTCTERGDQHRTNTRVPISNQSSVKLSSHLLRLVATWKSWLADLDPSSFYCHCFWRRALVELRASTSISCSLHFPISRRLCRCKVRLSDKASKKWKKKKRKRIPSYNVISGFLSQTKSFSSFLFVSFSSLDRVCSPRFVFFSLSFHFATISQSISLDIRHSISTIVKICRSIGRWSIFFYQFFIRQINSSEQKSRRRWLENGCRKIVEKKNWTKRGREEGEEKVAKLKKSEEERWRAMKSKSGELATRKMLWDPRSN